MNRTHPPGGVDGASDDDRLTFTLITELVAVLERYGYRPPVDTEYRQVVYARLVAAARDLARTYEGQPPPPTGPRGRHARSETEDAAATGGSSFQRRSRK